MNQALMMIEARKLDHQAKERVARNMTAGFEHEEEEEMTEHR